MDDIAELKNKKFNPQRTSSYGVKIEDDEVQMQKGYKINFKDISFPMELRNIKKF